MVYEYPDAKIYEIKCNETGMVYIGSTNKTLEYRLKIHEYDFNRYQKNSKRAFYSSFDIIKNHNYTIYLLEEYPCDSKLELHQRETLWQTIIPCINIKKAAGFSKKEYMTEYREKNKNSLKNYKNEYAKIEIQCECGCVLRKNLLARHKKTQKHIKLLEQKNI